MALNPSIFGNMLNAPKSPEEYAAERENLLASRQANVLNRQKMDEYAKGVERQGQLRNLLAGGADSSALRQAGFLDEASNWDKNAAEVGLKKSQGMKAEAEAQHAQLKAASDRLGMIYNAASGAKDQQSYTMALQGLRAAGVDISGIPDVFDPAYVENAKSQALTQMQRVEQVMKDREFGLKANNEIIGPDGAVNQTLLGAKKQIAQAGASSVNVNTGQKGFDNELKLRDDFKQEPVYKAHQAIQSAHSTITQSLKAGTPAGDLAGATKFMKILDENSVVRESELGMAMAATGLLDRVQNYANSIINGNKLTPKQRQEFQQLADAIYGESVKAYNSKRGEYTKLGAEYGLNADRAIGGPASLAAKPVISAEDQQAAAWANANPNDPRAAKIKQKLGM